jgi:hypothetical protein
MRTTTKTLLAFGIGLCALAMVQAASAQVPIEYTLRIVENNAGLITITTDSPQYAGTGGLIASGLESAGPISFSLDASIPLAQSGTFIEGLIETPGATNPANTSETIGDALLFTETSGSATVRFTFASYPFNPSFIPSTASDFSQLEVLGPNVMTVIAGNTGFRLIQPIITSDVPEPETLSLFGAALVGAFVARRRKKKAA